MVEKEITLEFKKPETIVLLIFLAIVFVLEVQVTLSTPISFGDEGFHTRMAQWMGENAEYPVWTPFEGSDAGRAAFDRPPVWNLLEGSFIFLFGYSDLFIKIFTPIIVFVSGIVLFILSKKLYNEKVGLIATIIFVTIPSYVTYSVLFYTDILFTFYFMMFSLTFILAIETNSKRYWLVSAIFGSLAALTKMPGVSVFAIVTLTFLYQLIKENKVLDLFKKYAAFLVITLLICGGFFVRSLYYYNSPYVGLPLPFFEANTTSGYFEEQYEFSGRTEASGTELGLLQMGIVPYLEFAYGNIWFVVFGCLAGLFLFFYRKKKTDILILISLVTIVFILFQSMWRAEDTARHTLGWATLISLIAANYFEQIYEFIKKHLKGFWIIALVVFVIVIAFSYQNISGKLGVMSQVKQFSPSFFEACDWVKENLPEDSLLFTVWSHRASYNCQRGVIGNFADISVSNDLDHILSVAEQHGITHLFIQKFSIDYQNRHLQEKYDWEFVELLENNPEYFNNVYENGLPLEQCSQQGGCDGNIVYEIVY